jgi:hypothetical protein
MEPAPKAVRSDSCEPCSGTPLAWRNLSPQESEERARARAYYEKVHPLHPTDPFGQHRMERVKTDISVKRLCNQLLRERGVGEPTRAELRAERAQMRDEQPKLTPQQIDRNAYRHPAVRERCPRDMPKRRTPGWAAANFVLPRKTIEGLTLLTKSMANREGARRSGQPYGFQRRYPKTRNYWVVTAVNYLLEEHGLSQFCVEEAEPVPGRVRRFAIPTH